MSSGHGGNLHELAEKAGCSAEQILDFSSSINPLGPPEFLHSAVSKSLEDIVNYPDPRAEELVKAAARKFGISESSIAAANGSEQIIYAIPRAFKLNLRLTA